MHGFSATVSAPKGLQPCDIPYLYQTIIMVEYQVQDTNIAMSAATLRILLYNVGYCTELDGTMRDYVTKFYRYLYTPRPVVNRAKHSLATLIHDHKPDVCCLAEIHHNVEAIPSFQTFASADVSNKYGPGLLRRLPFFRKNCNGVFTQRPYSCKKHWFRNGAKKLIYEVDLGHDVTLLFAHFSLKASTRKKQYEELKKWVKKCKKVILCGDFNTFRHEDDLLKFASECGLVMHETDSGTFPRHRPKKAVDLFLCSPNIKLKDIQVLRHAEASDHLPVLLEMRI